MSGQESALKTKECTNWKNINLGARQGSAIRLFYLIHIWMIL
jgi:hypothetical protein